LLTGEGPGKLAKSEFSPGSELLHEDDDHDVVIACLSFTEDVGQSERTTALGGKRGGGTGSVGME